MNNDPEKSPPPQANPAPELGLDHYEQIITLGLPDMESVALALFEIHRRKLYKQTYRSFQEYLRQRWHMSRARGYQLLHFARLKQASTTVDTERQARCLKADGTPRKKEEDDDPIRRAMVYLHNLYDRLNLHDREELIEFVGVVLDELKKKFLEETSGQRSAILQNEPTTRRDPESPLNPGNHQLVLPAQPQPKPLQA